MSRPARKSELSAALLEMRAEDSAIKYLARLPYAAAMIEAVTGALDLAADWEGVARHMRQRHDPEPVYQSTDEERSSLRSLAETYDPNRRSRGYADANYRELFAKLPPDAAAYVAYKVVRQVLLWAGARP